MSKVAIIADPDVASGFELAGVEVHPAFDGEHAEKLLHTMAFGREYGMIVIAEELMSQIRPRIREKMEKLTVPLVISVPMPSTPSREALGRKFVSEMIRQAIGYQIKV